MVPFQQPIPWFNSLPWWETTSLDSNRDRIHDSLAEETGIVNLGLSYSRDVKESDIDSLSSGAAECAWTWPDPPPRCPSAGPVAVPQLSAGPDHE